jgi:hypothetical protein
MGESVQQRIPLVVANRNVATTGRVPVVRARRIEVLSPCMGKTISVVPGKVRRVTNDRITLQSENGRAK